MVWGMTLETFTAVHVVLSLIGIVAGFVVLFSFFRGKRLRVWTALFLLTTVATSVTGFAFPVDHLLPSHIVGAISLVVLAVAIVALFGLHVRDVWRGIYVVSTALALYFNVFCRGHPGLLEGPGAPRARTAAERSHPSWSPSCSCSPSSFCSPSLR